MIVMKTSLGFSSDGDKCVVKIRGHVNPDGSSGVFVIKDVEVRTDQRVFGKDLRAWRESNCRSRSGRSF